MRTIGDAIAAAAKTMGAAIQSWRRQLRRKAARANSAPGRRNARSVKSWPFCVQTWPEHDVVPAIMAYAAAPTPDEVMNPWRLA
jgi:hypothetical protein